jgi:hypothetical protein
MPLGRTPPACLSDPTVTGCNMSFLLEQDVVFADDGCDIPEKFTRENHTLKISFSETFLSKP